MMRMTETFCRYFFVQFVEVVCVGTIELCRSFRSTFDEFCRPFFSSRSILPLICFSWWCSCSRQISTNCEIEFQFIRSTQKHLLVHSWLTDFSSAQNKYTRNFIFFQLPHSVFVAQKQQKQQQKQQQQQQHQQQHLSFHS